MIEINLFYYQTSSGGFNGSDGSKADSCDGCQCNGIILDGPGGNKLGECQAQGPNDKFFCYVNEDSRCPDIEESKRGGSSKLYFSYHACEKCHN